MTIKKKGRKWRSTCFEIKNDNKSVCLNTFTPDSPQTKNIDAAELLTDSQSNLNESIPAKRISIRIVPAIIPTTRISQKDNFCRVGDDEHNTERSDLEIYARITQNFHRTGYVSKVDQNKIQELDDDFNDLSLDINNQSTLNESVLEPSLIRSSSFDVSEYSHCVTAQDIVLKRCNQTDPIDFDFCYPDSVLQKCQKLGEGVYGEVFLLKNADGSATVLKIIPIEGPLPVNGEHQKKFDEIISEIIITQELSGLRDNALNCTECFTYVQNVRCVRGKYPTMLIDLWELYDEMNGSENEHPGIFDDDQLYIVFELEHGGRDLESFEFLNAEQAYSIFIQTALALSIAENELEFEHRDLHWGNLLIQPTKSKTILFKLNGEEIEVNACGVKATIIDFTLSRVTYNNVCIYNNLADDPDLFKSVGDYQFEIYKMMQKRNQNQWEHFEPYTNILWLHYIILKMIDGARYKRKKTPKHSKSIALMKDLSNELLAQQSSEQFVIQFYYQKPNEYTKAL
ncbi:serine/threonine-protein kinase haspin homolog [Chrysoperla carnea]|uniref:serine/threonine-protein kinase haspin homolog n=1 Tax=Chrysoperla carnea TaxID=189513 RepID=UPI001D08D56B|nr:serine/threonine-protein kinase haspin homolog [Chrysoperla carnea]